MTLTIFFRRLHANETTFDAFIKAKVAAARDELDKFGHQQIIDALKEHPDGVKAGAFKGVKIDGVNLAEPKDVAVAMKKRNCLVYYFPTGEYRPATQAHKTALKQMKLEEDRNRQNQQ